MPPRLKRRQGAFYRGGAISDPDAHHQVEIALFDGRLVRPSRCEKCKKKPPPLSNGKSGIQAHHDDYNLPLVVRWLCKGCHFKWHQKHVAKSRVTRHVLDPVALAEHVQGAAEDDRDYLSQMLDADGRGFDC